MGLENGQVSRKPDHHVLHLQKSLEQRDDVGGGGSVIAPQHQTAGRAFRGIATGVGEIQIAGDQHPALSAGGFVNPCIRRITETDVPDVLSLVPGFGQGPQS